MRIELFVLRPPLQQGSVLRLLLYRLELVVVPPRPELLPFRGVCGVEDMQAHLLAGDRAPHMVPLIPRMSPYQLLPSLRRDETSCILPQPRSSILHIER